MLQQILKGKQVQKLSKSTQKNIKGGGIPFSDTCYCIYRDPSGFLVISEDLPCNSSCPDGAVPISF